MSSDKCKYPAHRLDTLNNHYAVFASFTCLPYVADISGFCAADTDFRSTPLSHFYPSGFSAITLTTLSSKSVSPAYIISSYDSHYLAAYEVRVHICLGLALFLTLHQGCDTQRIHVSPTKMLPFSHIVNTC